MPYVYQTKRKDGKPHRLWRFQYKDWQGALRTGTGYTSEWKTRELADTIHAEQRAIRKRWRDRPKASDKPRSFEKCVQEYLAWGKSQGGRRGHPWSATHARMRGAHLIWWKEQLKVEFVSDLYASLARVEEKLRELQDKGKSGKTLQNYSDAICAFSKWCCSREYLESDPLKGLATFDTTPRTKRRAMSADEMARLLGSCAPQRRLCYEVAFTSGLRVGELRSLRIRNLDVNRSGLSLDAAWTKNRRPGFQPLPQWLVGRLEEMSKGKSLHASLLYVPSHAARELDKDLELAGIPKWTEAGKLDAHALRVAYVSWLLEAGASVKEAQVLARHSTPDLTMNVYARARDERLAQVAEAVGQTIRLANVTGTESAEAVVGTSALAVGCAIGLEGSTPAASTNFRDSFFRNVPDEPVATDAVPGTRSIRPGTTCVAPDDLWQPMTCGGAPRSSLHPLLSATDRSTSCVSSRRSASRTSPPRTSAGPGRCTRGPCRG